MVSLAHGTNDAQKTMGVITLALIANGTLPADANAPFWVILSCALAISLGTYIGGWRVIRTLGKGLVEIESPQGMAAESASAAVILLSSSFGYSLSTTHVATGSIIGTGLGKKGAEVRWNVAGRMATAWVFTLPVGRRWSAPARTPSRTRSAAPPASSSTCSSCSRSPASIYWRSRGNKVDHNNVNDEWTGSVAPAEPEPAPRPERQGSSTMSWINLTRTVEDRRLRPARRGRPARAVRRRAARPGPAGRPACRPRRRATSATPTSLVGGNPLGMIIAAICFLIILAAIGWGIYEVYQIGHPRPKQVNPRRPLRLPHREGLKNMALPPVLSTIIDWLRAGYPEGVPDVDYIPLFALLGSQLTNDEVDAIADELATETEPESAEAIRQAIAEVTDDKPTDADVNRVRARLAAGGWPLAKPVHIA